MLARPFPWARSFILLLFGVLLTGCRRERDAADIEPVAPAMPMAKAAALWAIDNPLLVALFFIALAVAVATHSAATDNPPS